MLPKIFWSKFTSDIRKTLFVRKKNFEKKILGGGGATLVVPDPQNFFSQISDRTFEKTIFGKKNLGGGVDPGGTPPPPKKKFPTWHRRLNIL